MKKRTLVIGTITVTALLAGGWALAQPWVFRYNLLKSLVVDRWTYVAQQSTCNVFAGAGDTFKVIDTNGTPGQTFATLLSAQSTGQEVGSITAPVTSWTASPTFGFSNPPPVCGQQPGPHRVQCHHRSGRVVDHFDVEHPPQ